MAIIGSHEVEQTPFIREWVKSNTEHIGEKFRIVHFIFSKKGMLVTVENDCFVVFIWKKSKLYKSISKLLVSSETSGERSPILYIEPDDDRGAFSVVDDDTTTCIVELTETRSGNVKYSQNDLEM